jgi:hypothetical protein
MTRLYKQEEDEAGLMRLAEAKPEDVVAWIDEHDVWKTVLQALKDRDSRTT